MLSSLNIEVGSVKCHRYSCTPIGYDQDFNGDVSEWDVSRMTNMEGVFAHAESFDSDISTWDVSSVANMDDIFSGAASFTHNLCGAAWTNSKATKEDIFVESSGSISQAVRKTTTTFLPQTKTELQSVIAT